MNHMLQLIKTLRRIRSALACVVLLMALLGASSAWASYAGTLDPRFGSSGVTAAQIVSGVANVADSLALQHDGKIVVGGYASAEPANGAMTSTAFVARLLPGGTPDPRFATGRPRGAIDGRWETEFGVR